MDGTVSASKLASGVVNNNKITIQATGIGTNKASASFTLNQSSDATITPVFGGDNIAKGSIITGHFTDFNTANKTDTWVPVGASGIIQHRIIKPFNEDGSIPESAMGWKNMVDYDTGVETFQNSITIFTRQGADTAKTLSRWDHEAGNYAEFKVIRHNGIGIFVHGINTNRAGHVYGWITTSVPKGDHYVGITGLANGSTVYSDTWGIYNGTFAGEALERVTDGTNTFDGVTYAYGSAGHVMTADDDLATIAVKYDLIKVRPHDKTNHLWHFTYDVMTTGMPTRWGMHTNGVIHSYDDNTIPGFYIRGVFAGNDWTGEHQMTIDYNLDTDISSAKQNTFTFDEEEEA